MAQASSLHRLLASMLLASACLPALAAPPPLEAFFNAPEIEAVKLSPKGHYIAILVNADNGKQVLAVRDSADLKKITIAATAGGDHHIVGFNWINEDRLSLHMQNERLAFRGNLDEFAFDRDGSNPTHLISGNWEHQQDRTDSHIKSKTLTADYSFHSVTHDGSDDILVSKWLWNAIDKYPDHSRLYRMNTRTFRLSDPLPGNQPPNSKDWLTDNSDSPRLVSTQSAGRCMVSYRAKNAAEWTEIVNQECYDGINFEPFAFDGEDGLFVTAGYKGKAALYRYDLKAMKLAKEPLVSAADFDFDGSPELDFKTGKVIGIHVKTDAQTTVWFDPRMKEIQAKIDALLPQTNNYLTCAIDCFEGPLMLIAAESDR